MTPKRDDMRHCLNASNEAAETAGTVTPAAEPIAIIKSKKVRRSRFGC